MSNKANITIIIISVLVALWAFYLLLPTSPVELENSRKDQARIFCALHRQWVEFQNGNATWGAMILDLDGKPVPCKSIMGHKVIKG